MVAAAPEAQPHVDLVDVARTVLSAVAHGLWQAVTDEPILGILVAAVVVAGLVRSARRAMYGAWERDPVRRFSRADRAVILARAGNRCERHRLVFGRCASTTDLQADHVHPWSRGGHTVLANGQALCKRHNQEKRARIPFNRELRRIEARRAGYFPAGASTAVERRATVNLSVRTPGSAPTPRGRVRRG